MANNILNVVYLGSPAEAIGPLDYLLERGEQIGVRVVGVVSQPTRPVGRKRLLKDPPVAAFAKERGLVVLQPERAGDEAFLTEFRALNCDVALTVAYGQILPDKFLEIPNRATINIHPSMLPRYRGATPVPAALLAGEESTGVTILFTVKALDAGNIILQKPLPILPGERADALTRRSFLFGADMLAEAFAKLADPAFSGMAQDPTQVSFCGKISKEDGLIDWTLPAGEVVNRFRAFYPWPGSYTFLKGQRLSLLEIKLASSHTGKLKPGEASFLKETKELLVGCEDGSIQIGLLSKAGGKPVDGASFWNGINQKEGVIFETDAS